MADLDATALAFAQTHAPLVAGVDVLQVGSLLPEDFEATTQTAVLIQVRPSPPMYHGKTANVSVQAKCYGPDSVSAWDIYNLLLMAWHERSASGVKWSQLAQTGQLLQEPDTQRPFILAFFSMHMEVLNV